jgi:hypothetical protein
MARVIKVNFEGVESGGGSFVRVPEGDYGLQVKEIKTAKGDKGPYLKFVFETIEGNKKGLKKSLSHIASLSKNSLWNLRNILEACGKQVPSKAVNIDLDKLVKLKCAGTVIDDQPYEGKVKSIITAFFPLADLGKTSDTGDEVEEGVDGEEAEEEAEAGDEEELFS